MRFAKCLSRGVGFRRVLSKFETIIHIAFLNSFGFVPLLAFFVRPFLFPVFMPKELKCFAPSRGTFVSHPSATTQHLCPAEKEGWGQFLFGSGSFLFSLIYIRCCCV